MTKGIIGAVIGDIVGSSREGKPISRYGFKLFTKDSSITDDTVLTIAVAEWMLNRDSVSIAQSLRKWGSEYPNAGYGSSFKAFLRNETNENLHSRTNGAVMRVSSVGYLASSLEECMQLAAESVIPSHNSSQAIAAAQATAVAIHMALRGSDKNEIREYLEQTFGYDLHRTYDELRAEIRRARERKYVDRALYRARIRNARPTVQDALIAFLDGDSYEDVIRKAIFLGGDADTEAAIAGGIAAAYYGVPEEIIEQALIYIPSDILSIINKVDGTAWKPSKLIPPKSSRWSRSDIVICGTNADETDGERAYYLNMPSRFRRHCNYIYPIHVIDANPMTLEEHIKVLNLKCLSDKYIRWHLHDVGLEKGGLSVERFRELFAWALELDNVLVTPTLIDN